MRKDFIVSGLTDFELLVRLDRIVLKEIASIPVSGPSR